MPAYDCPKASGAQAATGGAKGGSEHGARPKPAAQKKCGPDNGGDRCDCSVGEDGRRALYCSSYGWCGDTPEYRDGSPDHDCIQYEQQHHEEKANFFDGYNSGAAARALGGAPTTTNATSEAEAARTAAARARAKAAEARAKVAAAAARADTADARARAAAAAASADADR